MVPPSASAACFLSRFRGTFWVVSFLSHQKLMEYFNPRLSSNAYPRLVDFLTLGGRSSVW